MSLKVNPLIDVCHIAAENNSEVLFRQITLWNKVTDQSSRGIFKSNSSN